VGGIGSSTFKGGCAGGLVNQVAPQLINNKVIIDLIKEGHKVYSDASDA
jgi:hypothetical protein